MKAFPTPAFSINDEARVTAVGGEGGMDLRDYFAAKALQVVYEKNWDMFMNETFDNPEEAVEGAAKDAYELADAMMKAREA
jgi:hypothetical protein